MKNYKVLLELKIAYLCSLFVFTTNLAHFMQMGQAFVGLYTQ